MTSRKRYYELKAAGKCTKCTEPIGNSPSKVRCSICYTKSSENRQEAKTVESLCVQCGVFSISTGKCCKKCQDKNNEIKQQLNNKVIAIYDEDKLGCRVCDGDIDTLGIICNSCLSEITFTKLDALKRFGNICSACGGEKYDNLRFVSSAIEKPMKKYGQDLYKILCFSKHKSLDYKVLCHECYRVECLQYIKAVRDFFNQPKEEDVDLDL